MIRVTRADGKEAYWDLQAELARLADQEVRVIVTPLATVAELARIVGETDV